MSSARQPPRTSAAIKRFEVWFGGIFFTIGLAALAVGSVLFLRLGTRGDALAYLGAPLGVGTIFTLLGGVFLVRGLQQARKEARLLQSGTTTEAIVSSIEPTNTRVNRRMLWRVRYSYEDLNGVIHAGDSGYRTAEDAQSYRVGERVFIRYDPEQPSASIWLGREELPEQG
jgi:hypothetical protein